MFSDMIMSLWLLLNLMCAALKGHVLVPSSESYQTNNYGQKFNKGSVNERTGISNTYQNSENQGYLYVPLDGSAMTTNVQNTDEDTEEKYRHVTEMNNDQAVSNHDGQGAILTTERNTANQGYNYEQQHGNVNANLGLDSGNSVTTTMMIMSEQQPQGYHYGPKGGYAKAWDETETERNTANLGYTSEHSNVNANLGHDTENSGTTLMSEQQPQGYHYGPKGGDAKAWDETVNDQGYYEQVITEPMPAGNAKVEPKSESVKPIAEQSYGGYNYKHGDDLGTVNVQEDIYEQAITEPMPAGNAADEPISKPVKPISEQLLNSYSGHNYEHDVDLGSLNVFPKESKDAMTNAEHLRSNYEHSEYNRKQNDNLGNRNSGHVAVKPKYESVKPIAEQNYERLHRYNLGTLNVVPKESKDAMMHLSNYVRYKHEQNDYSGNRNVQNEPALSNYELDEVLKAEQNAAANHQDLHCYHKQNPDANTFVNLGEYEEANTEPNDDDS